MNCRRILLNPPTWLNFEQSRIEIWKIAIREVLLKAENETLPFKNLVPRNHEKGNESARWHSEGEIGAHRHWKTLLSCNGSGKKQWSVDMSLSGQGILYCQVWIHHRKFVCLHKEPVSDLFHPGLQVSVSQCYLPCITTRVKDTQYNPGSPWSLPLTNLWTLLRKQLQDRAELDCRRAGGQDCNFSVWNEQQLVHHPETGQLWPQHVPVLHTRDSLWWFLRSV